MASSMDMPVEEGMPAKVVLFDAVGTLMFPAPGAAQAYFEHGQTFGSRLTLKQVASNFKRARQKVFGVRSVASVESEEPIVDGHPSSDQIEKALWTQLVQQVFDDLPDTRELFEALWLHFAEPDHWELFPNAADCILALKDFGCRLAIASNFDSRLLKIVEAKPALKPIEWVFCSSEVGFRKPDLQFYHAIESELTRSNVKGRFIMIGDDLENDCLAPRRVGWTGWFLDRRGQSSENARHVRDLGQFANRLFSEQ